MKTPMISVIIPCYNVDKYINECLDSITSQTYQNIEIICVDDGSIDNTVREIEKYIKKDSRIKLIVQKNLYAGVARNNGMEIARGKYLFFFDGDDYCDETLFEEMIESAEKYDSDIVACDIKRYDNKTGKYDYSMPFFKSSLVNDYEKIGTISYEDIPNEIFQLASTCPGNKLYRKAFIEDENLKYQDSRRDNDEYFVLMTLALAKKISWVDKKLVVYRVNNPNSLQGFGDESIDTNDLLSTLRTLREGLKKKNRYDLLKNSFKNQIIIRYVGMLEGQRSWNNFKDIFYFTKNVVFKEFEIDLMNEDDVDVRPEDRRRILSDSPEEYLFWKLKNLESSNGERYMFPYGALGKENIRIGLYGAGVVGKSYYRQLRDNNNIEVVGVYDKNPKNDDLVLVEPITSIDPTKMDKIIIAIEAKKIADEIKKQLLDIGFKPENIVWQI